MYGVMVLFMIEEREDRDTSNTDSDFADDEEYSVEEERFDPLTNLLLNMLFDRLDQIKDMFDYVEKLMDRYEEINERQLKIKEEQLKLKKELLAVKENQQIISETQSIMSKNMLELSRIVTQIVKFLEKKGADIDFSSYSH